MMQDYGVRVVRAYQQFSVGRIIFPPGVLRDRLVQSGLVEVVKPPESKIGSAVKKLGRGTAS